MLSTNKKRKNKYPVVALVSLILILDLLFLYYEKYNNQGLTLHNFKILYTGNILNLLTTVIAVLGTIFYSIKSKTKFNSAFLISFSLIITAVLILAAVSDKINLPLPNFYFMDHPIRKIFIGVLFTLFQFLELLFSMILWLSIFGGKELLVLRGLVNTTAVLMFLLIAAFAYINIKKNDDVKNTTSQSSINVAVVLGAAVWSHNAPSPSLAARVDKAEELYNNGIVNRIQLTGSNAPGELSEAEVAFNYIKLSGIDLSDVWVEKNTVSTSEQIRFIRDHIIKMKNIGKIIIVSYSYHLTRVREICKFYNIKAGFAASELKLRFEHNLYYKLKESVALLAFWFFAI